MISEEKVKIMAEMARYEKNHGKDDFRVYKYEKKDYIRLEQIKTSICLLIAYLILTGLLCVVKMDTVIMNLRDGKIIILAAVITTVFLVLERRNQNNKIARTITCTSFVYISRCFDFKRKLEYSRRAE